jgi:hypothetical protein
MHRILIWPNILPFIRLSIKQCCGAGPFLCGSGSSVSKISAPAPAYQKLRSIYDHFPHIPYFRKNSQKFSWFKKNFTLFKTKNDPQKVLYVTRQQFLKARFMNVFFSKL